MIRMESATFWLTFLANQVRSSAWTSCAWGGVSKGMKGIEGGAYLLRGGNLIGVCVGLAMGRQVAKEYARDRCL
jgi:hypothetical protein